MSTQKSRVMKRLALLCAMSALALVVACDEKKETATAPSPTASAVPKATPPATATAEGDTEEDFEDEVLAAISPDNLESELAKLEAEINK